MRNIITAVTLFITTCAAAQPILTPGSKLIDRKWIKNSNYQMSWYMVRDTARQEIGKVNTRIIVKNDQIIVVSNISLKQMSSPWVDTTIARKKDLGPIYHSSHNGQREMALNFGTTVKGSYYNKTDSKNYVIADSTTQSYFDSNLYPVLITWLRLKEGLELEIPIYDYKPGSKTGVLKARVQEVKKGSIATRQSGIRKVWIVTVSDEIAGFDNGFVRYYIDIADRRLWKQEIDAGGRKMEMLLLEN